MSVEGQRISTRGKRRQGRPSRPYNTQLASDEGCMPTAGEDEGCNAAHQRQLCATGAERSHHRGCRSNTPERAAHAEMCAAGAEHDE
eukprot:8604092-Alexandrium_andersonii.AAC.1